MNVHWMKCINFGDQLNKFLYEQILYWKINNTCNKNKPYVISIGSLFSNEFINSKAIVCGIGIANRDDKFQRPLKTFLLRGKYSQQRYRELGYDCPENHGDPGLIFPLYFSPTVRKLYTIGYTPHIIDTDIVKNLFKNDKTRLVIDLRCGNNIESVIRYMLSCEYIVSSSLHGIVIAHAYNIPCVWVKPINKLCGDGVKFLDYYSAFNLDNIVSPVINYTDVDCEMIKTYPNPTVEQVKNVQAMINNSLKELVEFVKSNRF